MVIKGMFFPRRNFIINSTLPILFHSPQNFSWCNSFHNLPLARMYYNYKIYLYIYTLINSKYTYFHHIWACHINTTVIHFTHFNSSPYWKKKVQKSHLTFDIRPDTRWPAEKTGLIPDIWPNTKYEKGQISCQSLALSHSTHKHLFREDQYRTLWSLCVLLFMSLACAFVMAMGYFESVSVLVFISVRTNLERQGRGICPCCPC